MSQNAWIGAIVAVIVVGGGIWWFTNQPVQAPVIDNSTTVTGNTGATLATPADTTPAPTAGMFTTVQVASHNSASSCWSIVDGNVYDLTNWIGQHPGGEQAIKGLCGIDGTAAFHGQHGNAKQQADMLAKMKIGLLTQ